MGKKIRILKEEYDKVSKIKTINTKKNIDYMIGGAIDDFIFNLKSKNNIVEIGRGGFGIVYLDKTQPDSVFKISTKENTCRT